MIQSPDSEFENENDSQEEVIEVQENIIEALPENKSLVVSEDILPDSLSIGSSTSAGLEIDLAVNFAGAALQVV